jgi:hypothetical protein
MPPGERSNTGDQHVSALTERESPHGWVFDVAIGDSDVERRADVALSWVDYEYWSHGTIGPSVVAELVVRAVLDADPKRDLPEKFDCSTARRWVRDLDQRIREML